MDTDNRTFDITDAEDCLQEMIVLSFIKKYSPCNIETLAGEMEARLDPLVKGYIDGLFVETLFILKANGKINTVNNTIKITNIGDEYYNTMLELADGYTKAIINRV